MKINRLTYLLLLILWLMFSGCSRKEQISPEDETSPKPEFGNVNRKSTPDGHIIEYSYYENKQLEYQISYLGLKIDGVACYWYEDGTIRSEAEYFNGSLHGTWKQYQESGLLAHTVDYHFGKKQGYERWYHPNGQIMSEERYNGGVRVSEIFRWDADGNLIP